MLYILSRILRIDVSYVFRKFEKLSKLPLFWGCCNGKMHIPDQVLWVTKLCKFPEICFTHYVFNYVFTIYVLSGSQVFPKTTTKKILTVYLGDPSGPLIIRFFARIYFVQKTSAIKYKKWTHNHWLLIPTGVCSLWSRGSINGMWRVLKSICENPLIGKLSSSRS